MTPGLFRFRAAMPSPAEGHLSKIRSYGTARSAMRRFLPTTEEVRRTRIVRWLGPAVQHPRLWHMSRRGVALGLGIGVFFGLLIPVAQIPCAAVFAVGLRANITVAVAGTLVTNPFTFPAIYYVAYCIGSALMGTAAPPPEAAELYAASEAVSSWFADAFHGLASLGKPLVLGLAVLAPSSAVAIYMAVMAGWRWRVLAKLRQRRRERAARNARSGGGA
jgi:uncharacterized protein